jgi:hypothetical protein
MKDLFDGLLLYEITLLVLGVILFIILSIGLLYYILKKEQIAKLLFFFFIPIVMIGYPSITQITISNDKIELSKLQNQVIEDPDDTVAVQKMEQLTQKLEKRASTAEDLVQVSTSNLLLGNNKKAENLADKALIKDNTSTAARDIKRLATLQESMEAKPVPREETSPAREEVAPAREETTGAREETVSPAITLDPATTISESQIMEAFPQARDDTAKVLVSPQTNALKKMEVTKDLSKVKSYLLKRSMKNTTTTRESEKK